MKFNFMTLFPDLITSALLEGVVAQAIKKGLISYQLINPRDFAADNHKSVDDISYGGIDGMVMFAEILQKALDSIVETQEKNKSHKVFYMSPQGKVLTQQKAKEFLNFEEVTFVCGRYAGVDQRFLVYNQIEELSVGDYVLSGGELPALTVMDVMSRQIPGVLGNKESSEKDSFTSSLLEAPSFTRPFEWRGLKVPDVLQSGHHQRIKDWQQKLSVLTTLKKRPELLKSDMELDLKSLKHFYESVSEEEKIVCGIQNMVFEQNDNGK